MMYSENYDHFYSFLQINLNSCQCVGIVGLSLLKYAHTGHIYVCSLICICTKL